MMAAERVMKHTHTHLMALCLALPGSAGTREVKPIWILLKLRDGEWQWYQLGYMQLCTLLQTDNHASTSPLSFLQAGCPSCRPANIVKAVKAGRVMKVSVILLSMNILSRLCFYI